MLKIIKNVENEITIFCILYKKDLVRILSHKARNLEKENVPSCSLVIWMREKGRKLRICAMQSYSLDKKKREDPS